MGMGADSAPPGAVSCSNIVGPRSCISYFFGGLLLIENLLMKLWAAGHKLGRQRRNRLHILSRSPEDVTTRPRRCAYGSNGSDAGRIRGRLHRASGGRLCHATEWNWCQCRGCGSRLPNQDDGHAEADWEVRTTEAVKSG